MKFPRLFPSALALALLLPACKPQAAPDFLPPNAAAEFIDLRDNIMPAYTREVLHLEAFQLRLAAFLLPLLPPEQGEVHTALQQMADLARWGDLPREYARTGNPNLQTPHMKQTLLHLAVAHRKEALVRELLRQGADVNVRLVLDGRELDAPLNWAVTHSPMGRQRADKDSALRLINMLAAAGADTRGEPAGTALVLLPLFNYAGAEDVFLHLLDLGADPAVNFANMSAHGLNEQLLRRGWMRAVERLHREGRFDVNAHDEDDSPLLSELVESMCYTLDTPEDWQRLRSSILFLLEHGAQVNALNDYAETPLLHTLSYCCHPKRRPEGFQYECYRELLLLLLRHGGDLSAAYPAKGFGIPAVFKGKSAVEVLHTCPELVDWLRAQGVELPPAA